MTEQEFQQLNEKDKLEYFTSEANEAVKEGISQPLTSLQFEDIFKILKSKAKIPLYSIVVKRDVWGEGEYLDLRYIYTVNDKDNVGKYDYKLSKEIIKKYPDNKTSYGVLDGEYIPSKEDLFANDWRVITI